MAKTVKKGDRVAGGHVMENMMKKLYRFFWDCGRNGCVEGTFVADEEDVAASVGKEVCFGEILGKHVTGILKEDDFTVLDVSSAFIEEFERVIGEVGYNPLEFMSDEDEEDDHG